MFSFVRIACCAPELRVAEISFNHSRIEDAIHDASGCGASIILFPELSLTAYTCGDLFHQDALLDQARCSIVALASSSIRHSAIVVFGAPLLIDSRLFNCAIVIGAGQILGIVPKLHLPNSQEFYEARWFCAGSHLPEGFVVELGGREVPVGNDLLFYTSEFCFAIELCEDLWSVEPPSGQQALAGAEILLNLSASNEVLGKAGYRRSLVTQQSARCLAAYAYASAGPGESTTDLVFSGHCMIAENGQLLVESDRFSFASKSVTADVDVGRLRHERQRNSSFSSGNRRGQFRRISCPSAGVAIPVLGSLRPNSRTPFVPTDASDRSATCREVISIQATGLMKRIRHTNARRLVLGLSGGLDSTLALLVCIHALDLLRRQRSDILAATLPGPGSTLRTQNNAERLATLLGTDSVTIPVSDAVDQHLRIVGHSPETRDTVYENVQARERTQILMTLANRHDGLVVGTGDLSESALGWCTYNGDHMSMYHVNCSIPKTLVRYLIEWAAESLFEGSVAVVLRDICATPISPELLPPTFAGDIAQMTEDIVGPYELHDYFLYHMVRLGSPPEKILYLAEIAFAEAYDLATIKKWLELFIRRFFSQQFKRSAVPDGPKVGSVALSPRGDWRMPSDACADSWLAWCSK